MDANEQTHPTEAAAKRVERPLRPERPAAPPAPTVSPPSVVVATPTPQSLAFRRTIIPILLTVTFLLTAIGVLTQAMPDGSPLRAGVPAAVGCFTFAAAALVLAILNMLAVRRAARR